MSFYKICATENVYFDKQKDQALINMMNFVQSYIYQ